MESLGIIDSIHYPNQISFSRYQYPSALPEPVKQRIKRISRSLVEHLGFNESAFNIEYFYDESSGCRAPA